MLIHEAIREARTREGLSVRRLAEVAHVSPATITRIESGAASPRVDVAERILAAMGRSLVVISDSGPATPGQALAAHRARMLDLCRDAGVSDVRVFGSVARGQDTPDSDLDLMVRTPPGFSFADLLDLQRDIEQAVGFPVDVITDVGVGAAFESACREAVPL